ncbi:family A G protein-coupled receptor-like protein [Wolfiporia cocos MD-104 SS10]|uniref:Family A G protein-coupled receptor-like protein n=1 Tax=Wolfiporia cocos (strain MD-104) TaxID=742152 RepID=A0A2H3J9B6_WOLCO|nr:family A G protein-coupled receptor-like protein [Wolfiporia cocos MD-104 SS10]
MGNSLDHNPPDAARHITPGGSKWLWAVCAMMAASDLAMIFWAFSRARGTRLFHQIGIIVLTTATIAYFAMASDLGAAPVLIEFPRGSPRVDRQVFYVRYIQWFITLSSLLLELLLATGLTLSDIFTTIFMGWVFVICGLVGAFVPSTYKWGFYVIGVFGMFYIWWVLLGHGPRSTFAAGGAVRSGYLRTASYFSFLLMLYPIAWACSEGGNVISPTGEMIWYGILDLFAGPIFLFFFLWGLREVDMAAFGLNSGKYTDTGYGYGPGAGMATAAGANGVTTGAVPAAGTVAAPAATATGAGAAPAAANGAAAAPGGVGTTAAGANAANRV